MKHSAILQRAPFAAAVVILTASLSIPTGLLAADKSNKQPVTLTEAVRHQLALMPRLTVFDDLSFKVDGGTVTLTGQVAQPIAKSDAESIARHVEGVVSVVNNIEVLPLSPDDDRLRLAVYRAIYGAPALSARYALMASPPIHIVVKNGVVRLEGFVANGMDRTIAGMQANSVFGAFQVVNDLQIG